MHYSGFSWLAGIALIVWALQRRLYMVTALGLVYGIAFNVLIAQLNNNLQIVLIGTQFVIFGSFANRLHRMLLERNGWLRTEEEPLLSGEKE